MPKIHKNCELQSSAVITRSNTSWYCTYHCRTWGRISIRGWTHKDKTPHNSPWRASNGVSFVNILKENDRIITVYVIVVYIYIYVYIYTKWLPPWRKGRISCLWIKSVFDCLKIGIIHEIMVVHMTWVWTFFNNYIYIYTYIYHKLSKLIFSNEQLKWAKNWASNEGSHISPKHLCRFGYVHTSFVWYYVMFLLWFNKRL